MYIDAIQAKLSILDQIWNQNIKNILGKFFDFEPRKYFYIY